MTSEKDNWGDRKENMICAKCMHYIVKNANPATKHVVGRCRRHAPTMQGWPVVFVNDWCGDFKLNENVGD